MQTPDNARWDKASLHTVLYGPDQAYRDQAVYDALSQLNKLLERFLALQAFEADAPTQQRFLLASLVQHKEENAYLRHRKKAQQTWEKYAHRDLAYFEGQYQLYRQDAVFEAGMQRRSQDQRLEATVTNLDLHYWCARLKYSCELLNRGHILNQPAPEILIEPLETWITSLPDSYLQEPAIHAYLLIFQALQAPHYEHRYQFWIDWLDANSQLFSPAEAADMYNYAQNYCVRRINQGDSRYLDQLFRLFEQLVSKDLVLDQGYMDHRKLKNMVTVGIRLQAYDWVDTFLHTYRDKLLPAYQVDAYRFNLASLRYAQGLHSEALALLQQVEFQDVFYHLSAKSLMLRLYYETDEDTALIFLFENFRLYLQRNRAISSFQQQVHLNLLRFSRKLHRLRERKYLLTPEVFQRRLQQLEKAIRSSDEVANSSWLLEQVAILGEVA